MFSLCVNRYDLEKVRQDLDWADKELKAAEKDLADIRREQVTKTINSHIYYLFFLKKIKHF